MGNDQLYTISKAAEYLSVSISTLRNWDKEGKFKSLRTLGGQRRYRIQDLENFKKGRNVGEGLVLRIPRISWSWSMVLIVLVLVLAGFWKSNYVLNKKAEVLKPDKFNLTIIDKTPIVYTLYPEAFQKEGGDSLKAVLGNSQVEVQSPNLREIRGGVTNAQELDQPVVELNEQDVKSWPVGVASSIVNLLGIERNAERLIDTTEEEYVLSLRNVGGKVTVPKGETKIWIDFPVSKFNKDSVRLRNTPIVTITPLTAALLGWYRVTGVTEDGFYVEISRPMSGKIEFNWIAVGIE